MAKRVTIEVRGAWAYVDGIPKTVVPSLVRFYAPKYQYSRKYREGIWDGTITLANGKYIPAGLSGYVKKLLKKQGYKVSIRDKVKNTDIDVSQFNKNVLKGIELYDHQYELAVALLSRMRGCVEAPTGSGKTEVIAAVARFLYDQAELSTLVVVPRKGLVTQTVKRMREYFGSDGPSVGQMGGGSKREGAITVSTAQSLLGFQGRTKKGKKTRVNHVARRVIENADVLILDECHTSSSDSWNEIAMACPAQRRYGLSATPLKNKDLPDARMKGASGPIVKKVEPERVIGKELVTQPKICAVVSDRASHKKLYRKKRRKDGKLYTEKMDYQRAYKKAIVNSRRHNQTVIESARWLINQGRRTLILCRQRKHHKALIELAKEYGLRFEAIQGPSASRAREYAKNALYEGEIDAIIATTVFDMGEDTKGVEAMVLAEGIKDKNIAVQRVGRGMRQFEGSDGELWVVDIVSTADPRLIDHGASRIEAYEEKGYPVCIVEEWPDSDREDPAVRDDLFPFREMTVEE